VDGPLTRAVCGRAALDLPGASQAMVHAVRNLEYFHDHARLEDMLFDGALSPQGGALRPDRDRPGLGLTFKKPDAEQFRVS
jgi:hypothetical protein